MKYIVWLSLISVNAFAAVSSTAIGVTFRVPLKLQVTAQQKNRKTFAIHEISNSPSGYEVVIETDATIKTVDGIHVNTSGNRTVISQVAFQDQTVDRIRSLELATEPSYMHLTIQAN